MWNGQTVHPMRPVLRKHASLWRKRRMLSGTVCAATLLASCTLFTSNDEFGLSWSGKPVDQLKQSWGQPADQQKHSDGSSEIRYDLAELRCTYWFTVDKAGKIVSYRYAIGQWGSCKPM